MSTVFFDTSVLVPALVDQLANHPACFSVFRQYSSGENSACCSTHSLAECYSVLTALPISRKITTVEARILIEESILGTLRAVPLDDSDYRFAVRSVSDKGLSSGIVYDALHLAAARKAGCTRIYTYNIDHFTALGPEGIEITAP